MCDRYLLSYKYLLFNQLDGLSQFSGRQMSE